MKKLIISIGILVLASSLLGFKAQAHYGRQRSENDHWRNKSHQEWWGTENDDAEYDWVIKPEVLGNKLRIIANPVFISAPRGNEYIVLTGDPDHWQGDTWGMRWSQEGYVTDIPLSKLPRNKRIRMNYVVMSERQPVHWALFSEENDDEWTGPGDHGKTVIDFMIQSGRVVPVE